MPSDPLTVAIILTWNQKDDTVRCLRSFQTVEYPRLEIVLVDNASDDGTVESVFEEFPNVHVVRNSANEGVAGGRNIGIAYATRHFAYDYLLYIDNDTVVTRNFLRPLVNTMEGDRNIGIAVPKLYIMGEERVLDSAGGSNVNFWTGSARGRGYGEIDQGQYDGPDTPACVPCGIALARRSVIEICNGFNAEFNPYGPEDLDFSLRVKEQGFSFRYVPASVIYHKGNKTGFGTYTSEYAALKGRNLRKFMKRHATRYQWVCFNALLPLLALRTLIREIARGNAKAPLRLVRGYLRS
jgi:GT2 family glycosyltransferase